MAAVSPIIGRTLGHYRVIEEVGAGGMGVVYRARDERLPRDVAIKILHPGTLSNDAARKNFREEALALSRLSHTNVAHIYDFDTQDGIDFLVMEFISGTPLDKQVIGGPLPEEEVVRLGEQIAMTLNEVSEFGIIHRDLKPGNIILTPKGEAKLLDFGLAKLLRAGENETTRSQGNVQELVGTLPYMSPEQLTGQASDFRTDIYSLGAVLYELATAKPPFDGVVLSTLIDDIVHKTPLPPRQLNSNLSLGLESIIMRCLKKDPGQRYQAASEVHAALQTLEFGSDSHIAPTPRRYRLFSRRLLGIAALLLGLLVATLISVRKFRTRLPTSSQTSVNELVILPLHNSNADVETRAFGDGLIYTLTSRLTHLTGAHPFQVVPASEIHARGVSTLQEASQEFGANLGLEVNVERAGEMLRVNYALIDTKLHRQLRGDTITASMSDPFAIEDRVAESVVDAMQIELHPDEERAQASHGTVQPAAYDYYLQGRGYLEEFRRYENVENAILEFNHALQQDPNYSLALSGLGEAFWRKYEHTKQIEWVEKGKSACDRAIQLRPDQAAGQLCLGLLDAGTGAYEKAAQSYKIAVELEPTNDGAYSGLAGAYEQLHDFGNAEDTFREAIKLRPNWVNYNQLGAFYLRTARYADAVDMFSRTIALAPDSFVGYSNLGSAYVLSGQYAKATPLLERSLQIRPTAEASSNLGTAYFQLRDYSQSARTFESAVALDGQNYEVWGNLGDAYYWAPGEREKAQAAYQKALDLALKSFAVNPRDPGLLGFIAEYYAMLGDKTRALNYIGRALQMAPESPDLLFTAGLVFNQCGKTEQALNSLEKAVAAGYSRDTLRDTPNFDTLRDQPRLQRMLGTK